MKQASRKPPYPDVPTFWFDKDGVLAKYDYSIYEAEDGCTAPWLTRNAHIFRHLPPHREFADAFRRLYLENEKVHPADRCMRTRILTAVSDGVTLSEQVLDSWDWIKDNMPEIDRRVFYAVAVPKQEIPMRLKRAITPMDVLIDDFEPNLKNWAEAGGSAIKAVNGINSESKSFPSIDIAAPAEQSACILTALAQSLMKGQPMPGPGFLRLTAHMEPPDGMKTKREERAEN